MLPKETIWPTSSMNSHAEKLGFSGMKVQSDIAYLLANKFHHRSRGVCLLIHVVGYAHVLRTKEHEGRYQWRDGIVSTTQYSSCLLRFRLKILRNFRLMQQTTFRAIICRPKSSCLFSGMPLLSGTLQINSLLKLSKAYLELMKNMWSGDLN